MKGPVCGLLCACKEDGLRSVGMRRRGIASDDHGPQENVNVTKDAGAAFQSCAERPSSWEPVNDAKQRYMQQA